MSKMTRRAAILAGMAAALVGGMASGRTETELLRILRRKFGPQVAESEAAAEFARETAAFWEARGSRLHQTVRPRVWMMAGWVSDIGGIAFGHERFVMDMFMRSTNFVRHEEVGEELFYIGVPNPYQNSCANPLSAQWL